jgi:hypothetical protein
MSKNTIEINGTKLKELLTTTTGKSLGDIALENGYSRSLLNEAVRVNRASPIIQTLCKLYGIAPEAYEIKAVKPENKKSGEQVSFNDFYIDRDELKAIIKEAITELIQERGGLK